eukprot:JP447605.1.p2 GENE.JP447605.1~~JP447605.1.p2  ORF type:complete len:168 (-),score=44.70 JP447605.1:3-506(-)
MVKSVDQTHTYSFPWEKVTAVTWRKYPNPQCPQVLSVDVLDRRVNQDGTLWSKRLLTCTSPLPGFVSKLTGSSHVYVLEESVVDRNEKVMQVSAKNVSWGNVLEVAEECRYSAVAGDANATRFDQKCTYTVFSGFANYLENLCTQAFNKNAHKGRQVMQDMCTEMNV